MARPLKFVVLEKDEAAGMVAGFFIDKKTGAPVIDANGKLFKKVEKAKLEKGGIDVIIRVPKATMALLTAAQKERVAKHVKADPPGGSKEAKHVGGKRVASVDANLVVETLKAELGLDTPAEGKTEGYVSFMNHNGNIGLVAPGRVAETINTTVDVGAPTKIGILARGNNSPGYEFKKGKAITMVNVEVVDNVKDVLSALGVTPTYRWDEKEGSVLHVQAGDSLLVIAGLYDPEGGVLESTYSIAEHDEVDAASSTILKGVLGYGKERHGRYSTPTTHAGFVARVLSAYRGDGATMLADLRKAIAAAPKGSRVRKQGRGDIMGKATQLGKLASAETVHPLPVLHETYKRDEFITPGGMVSMNQEYEWTHILMTVDDDSLDIICGKLAYVFMEKGTFKKRLSGDDVKDVLVYHSYYKTLHDIPKGARVDKKGAPYTPPKRLNDLLPYITENGFTATGFAVVKAAIKALHAEVKERVKKWESKRAAMAKVLKVVNVKTVKATDAFEIDASSIPYDVLNIVDLGTYHGHDYSSSAATKEGWRLGKSFHADGYKASGKLVKLLKGKETEVLAWYDKKIKEIKKSAAEIDKAFKIKEA